MASSQVSVELITARHVEKIGNYLRERYLYYLGLGQTENEAWRLSQLDTVPLTVPAILNVCSDRLGNLEGLVGELVSQARYYRAGGK